MLEPEYRLAFSRASIPLAFGASRGLLEVNDAMCRFLGRSAAELRGLGWEEFTHPEDVERSRREVSRIRSGEIDAFELDKRYVRKDGSYVWGRVHVTAVRGASRDDDYLFIQVDDVTGGRAEDQSLRDELRALRTSQQRALEIHDNVVQGLVVAKLALEMQDLDRLRKALKTTLDAAQNIVASLMGEGPIRAGDLTRTHPASLDAGDAGGGV